LLESSKDRAELLMITDLVRNDLGQVADIGSVRTESLLRVRPTPSVWHLESTVRARLSQDCSWDNVMRALSPAGSISGTPKHRAVDILASLEPVNRGPYCGAIGWVDANGDADFAVGIRTLMQSGSTIRIHGGGGIVADSDPEAEYYESLMKIAPLIDLLSASTDQRNRPRSLRHA
jgi:para-aminobenzoate synthetase component 1